MRYPAGVKKRSASVSTTPAPRPAADIGAEIGADVAATIARAVAEAGGWLPFDRFMALALYAPGQGYYSRDAGQIGAWPAGGPAGGDAGGTGSDFVTAPELSPLFGRALAVQVAQALTASATDELWEFGAGTGALAAQLLEALDAFGVRVRRYHIVDLSGALVARQRARLADHGERVQWHARLPASIEGVVVGNELLDAMPVKLLRRQGDGWMERGVVVDGNGDGFGWADRPTAHRPPPPAEAMPDGSVTEIHPQAEAFVRTLAATLRRGAVFLIDYGFPEAEYHHPQRRGGTLMCHRGHRADADPLVDVGLKDITAHVNFSAIALAAQDAGLEVLGYTSQARFLLNCGIAAMIEAAPLPARVAAQRLLHEHEMGELFKVIGLARGCSFDAVGFAAGDRTHRL